MIVAADVRAGALLSEVASIEKVGVEVGVFKAHMSVRLLASDETLTLYMVDPWRASEVEDTYLTTDDYIARSPQAEHDRNMAESVERVAEFGDRAKVLRMTSEEAAKQFADGSIDFVFIDGDHSVEGVRLDLACWWPKVRSRGVVSGHDYRKERNYGVIQAVHEFCAANGLRELRLGGNYTWFLTKP
jgi:hypothetical protein